MKLLDRIKRSEFVKNTLTLVTGTSIAQIIGILLYPVLSRMFLPSEFGLLSTIAQISAIIMIISTGKYEGSILITETKQEGANVIGLVLKYSAIILLISFVILQLMGGYLADWLNQDNLPKWLFICPLSAYVIIIYNCFNEWCVRNKYYKVLSWNKIINTLSHTFGKVLFGIVRIFSNGLVIGDLLGRTVSAGTCVYRGLKNDKEHFLNIDKKQFKPLIKKYNIFPKYYMPDQLLSTIGVAMPVFFISGFFNTTEVGYYTITMNVLSIPLSFISIAVRDVFRQRANEDYSNTGSCIRIYKKLLYRLLAGSIIISLLVYFFLPSLFSIFLGAKWRVAGEYAQILLPMMMIDFVAMALSGVFIITKKLNVSLIWQIYYVFITILSLWIGCVIFKDIKATLMSFAIGRGSAYLLFIILSYKYAKGTPKNK